jgi:hypothetical protein
MMDGPGSEEIIFNLYLKTLTEIFENATPV